MRVETIASKLLAAGAFLLAGFRSEARTLGLSPKALAGPIGALITAALAALGLTPAVIGHELGVSPEVVAAVEVALAAKIAAILLPPGRIAPDSVTKG